MKATIKNNCLPIGQYTAEFDGIEPVESEQFGPGWKWKFVVCAGRFRDKECTRITGDAPSPRNAAGRLLAALAGKTPTDGMDIDSDEFLGRRYIVMVQATANGDSTRVESFVPVETTDEAPATAATIAPAAAATDKPCPF